MDATASDSARLYQAGNDMTVDHRTLRNVGNTSIRQRHGAFTLVMLVVVAVVAIVAVTWLVVRVTGAGDTPAPASVNTEISIDPVSGPPGTVVRVTGVGFEPGRVVQVLCQDPMNPQLGQFRAAADGSFEGDVVIPDDNWIRRVGVQLAIVASSGQAQDSDRQGLVFFMVER